MGIGILGGVALSILTSLFFDFSIYSYHIIIYLYLVLFFICFLSTILPLDMPKITIQIVPDKISPTNPFQILNSVRCSKFATIRQIATWVLVRSKIEDRNSKKF